MQANSYFSRFFVNEARGNNNIFPSAPAAVKALIYNYAPVYTGYALLARRLYARALLACVRACLCVLLRPGSFEQCYFFA